MALDKKMFIVVLYFAAVVGIVLSGPLASPHHHYKEKVSIRTKYKGYYPIEQPLIAYGIGGGYGHLGGEYGQWEGKHGGYGHLGGGHGYSGGGYGHSGGAAVATASVAVASAGASAASASASSAGGYGYGR